MPVQEASRILARTPKSAKVRSRARCTWPMCSGPATSGILAGSAAGGHSAAYRRACGEALGLNRCSRVELVHGVRSSRSMNPFELDQSSEREGKRRRVTASDGVQPAPFCPDPWPRFDPSERSRAFRAMAHEPLFSRGSSRASAATHHGQEQDTAALDQRSEPCRRETRLLPFLTRCENLPRHIFDRGRRNQASRRRVSELSPKLGVRSLLLRSSLLRSGLLRCGLAALLGLGFLHCHCCLLVARHTCLIPTGFNRPVPAPIHTKSFNIWKTKFPRNGLFF